MKEFKLSEDIYLKQDGYNVTVFEKVEVNKLDSNKKPTGDTYLKDRDIAYCGTVYQALQHIVRFNYDIEEDLLLQFRNLIMLIDSAEEDIKNRFSLEVKKA